MNSSICESKHFIMMKLKYMVLLLGALFVCSASKGEHMPNIVVILTDDQGYADISFNSEHPEEVSTPHMDKLAREGIFFLTSLHKWACVFADPCWLNVGPLSAESRDLYCW